MQSSMGDDVIDDMDESLVERDVALQTMLEGLESLAKDVETLGSNQEKLGSTVDQILASLEEESTPDTPYLPWTRGERSAADWTDLADWVDMMAAAHSLAELPACWLAHEGLVLEIEAARSAWLDAGKRHAKGPTSLLWHWYSYTWTPLRHRLGDWHQCRSSHQPDPVVPVTARGYLPQETPSPDQLPS